MILSVVRPYLIENAAEGRQLLTSTLQGGTLFVTGFFGHAGALGLRQWWRREGR